MNYLEKLASKRMNVRIVNYVNVSQAITEVLTVAALFGQHWKEVGLPHPIPIACVGCGDADRKLLEGIAKITKGMFTMVDSMEELSTFFRRQVILSRFVAQFSHDMSQLRSLLALQQFMRACGEAVEESEARSLRGLLGAMLIGAALEDSDDDDDDGDSKSYPTPPPLGTRIRRGPQWKWGDQDGRGVGTIVKHSDTKGWVDVRWDNGRKNSYRFGKDNAMDVKIVNEPRKVTFHEGVQVGVRVVRGKDWKWGDQDGGSGSKGYVYDVSELTGVCKVRWDDGRTNTYRNGAEGAFDLRVLPEDVSGLGTPSSSTRGKDPEECSVM
ncbi:E3 ubiquitin- ligase HERC2 [Paramuricea clavata]|uniref:E3 ubiquitin- ligase HERC2 n=1 Tax=Paramuricea clavata TaxID=317549 RepID=A0A7D9D9Q4_PARCT|nr:E3 ubiquitin- ligase HERC2 [Paramuricea clavata]